MDTDRGMGMAALPHDGLPGESGVCDEWIELLSAAMRTEAGRHTVSSNGTRTLHASALTREVLRQVSESLSEDFRRRSRLLMAASYALRLLLAEIARETASTMPRRVPSGAPEAYPALGRICFDRRAVEAILDLDAALDALADYRPRWVQVMHCTFFGRMRFAETAAALGVMPGTVRSDWLMARVWVHRWILEHRRRPGGPSRERS